MLLFGLTFYNVLGLDALAWGISEVEYPLKDVSNPDDLVPTIDTSGGYAKYEGTGYDFEADVETNLYYNDKLHF